MSANNKLRTHYPVVFWFDSQKADGQGAMLDTWKCLAGIFLQWTCAGLPALAFEPRVDLTVCTDRSADSFRVIEVAYRSLQPVPCTTYLTSERRSLGASSVTSEQVAWARNSPGICERSARQLRRKLEGQGYLCLTHKEDPKTVRERIAAQSAAPVEINMVGRERVDEIPVPVVFVDTAAAEASERNASSRRRLFIRVEEDRH